MDKEMEDKQNYLRQEILEKNYDADEFVQFLVDKKGEDATDLEVWSFQDLKKVVKEFLLIKGNNHQSQENTLSNNYSGQIHTESDDESDSKNNNNISDEQNKIKNLNTNEDIAMPNIVKLVNYEENIACEKSEETAISKYPKIKITISFPEKHGGGFFSKAYMTYLVTTFPTEYKVRRRYSDFEWLRNILTTIYPGVSIPPIAKKNYGDRFNEVFVSKRMRFLEKFLDALASNSLIKNSKIFQEFISIENDNDFNNMKKDFTKYKPPAKLSEIKSLTGDIKSKINKEMEIYADNTIKNYISLNEIIIKKLGASFKNLFMEMNQVSLRMKEISELYSQLHSISEKTKDNETVLDTYRMLSKLMNDWGEAERKQSILIDVELKDYFKYIKSEFVAFRDLAAKMDINKSAYYKAETRLTLKKEELFRQGNLIRWEIPPEEIKKCDKNELLKNKELAFSKMLIKESQHVHLLKQNYGFYANQLITEFERIRNLNGARHKSHIMSLSQNHSDILADLHVMWADLLSYYSDVYDSNSKHI